MRVIETFEQTVEALMRHNDELGDLSCIDVGLEVAGLLFAAKVPIGFVDSAPNPGASRTQPVTYQ